MTESLSEDEVVREIYIEAAPDRVFEFFTVSEKLEMWWGSGCEVDPRPGGIYKVEFLGGMQVVRGEFVEVEPPHRIVHTWGWEGKDSLVAPGESRVEITLDASGAGTLVKLRHTGLKGTAGFHSFGWEYYLPRLVMVGQGEDPGPDTLADELGTFPSFPVKGA